LLDRFDPTIDQLSQAMAKNRDFNVPGLNRHEA